MVILKNVKKTDNYIECDYHPNGHEDKGHIVYDYVNNVVIEKKTVPDYDDLIERYYGFALKRLKRVINSDDFKNNAFKDEYMAYWV